MKIYHVRKKDLGNHLHFSDQNFWLNANIVGDFLYPWEANQLVNMKFQALYDADFFYFYFDVMSSLPIMTFIKDNNKKEVLKSDRVELFFMSSKGMNPYYCLEMDSAERVYDYRAKYYRIIDDTWSWPKDNLIIEVVKSDVGYKTFGKITMKSLYDLSLIQGNQMTVGIYRGQCTEHLEEKAVLKWISWIKPKSVIPDFHISSSFGKLIFM